MKTLSTNAVIVGSGSAGISAGFELYQQQIPFILLERGDKVGGAGKFGAHGVFAIDSEQQTALDVDYGYEAAFKSLTENSHYFVNGELLSRFLKKSGDNIERLKQMGLSVTVEQSEQKAHLSDPLVYHKFNDFKDKMQSWDKLPAKFEEIGSQVLTNTSAVDLDYDEHGLHAVIVEDNNGELYRINTTKVIFADGGYCGNADMMELKYDDSKNLLNLGEHKSDGTGIKLAEKLGADTYHNPVLFAHGCAPSFAINPMKRKSSVETLTNLPLFWVSKTGNRFVNENIVYDFAMWGNAAHNVHGKYYVIVDQATIDTFKNSVVDLEDTFERQFCEVGETPRTTVGPLPNIQGDFDDAIQTGEVVKAVSITELANKLSVPINALKQTIDKYNQAVDNQVDEVFLKDSNELIFDISQGPFYAIVEHCAILGTLDGVNVNSNCEPVRKDGSAISGLYVVGNNVNGLYTDGYPSYEGIANGFAFVSGWIAGEEVAKIVIKEKMGV